MEEENIEPEKHRTRGIAIQVIFILAIIFASYAMIYTTKTLIENREVIGRDPLQYAIEVYNFSSCQCYDYYGNVWPPDEVNFSNLGVIESGPG